MKFYGFSLLLIAIFCITVAMGRNIDCTSNAFLKSKSIACRGGWRGGGGNNGGGGGNNGGGGENNGGGGGGNSGTNGDGTGDASNMMTNLMRTAQQIRDMISNPTG